MVLGRRLFSKALVAGLIAPKELSNIKKAPRFKINSLGSPIRNPEFHHAIFDRSLEYGIKHLSSAIEGVSPKSYWQGMPTYYSSGIWDTVIRNNYRFLNMPNTFETILVDNGFYCAINVARLDSDYFSMLNQAYIESVDYADFIDQVSDMSNIGGYLDQIARSYLGKVVYIESFTSGQVAPNVIMDVQSAVHSAEDMYHHIGGIHTGNFTIDMNAPMLNLLYEGDPSYVHNRGFFNENGRIVNPPDVAVRFYD